MAVQWSGTRWLFVLAAAGLLAGVVGAIYSNQRQAPQPPVFSPAPNPYAQGIYANGIVESDQPNGSNVNLYPEVAGTVIDVLVGEGQAVTRGTPLLKLDDTIQRATVEQQHAQALSAQALLDELKAQPRPETLSIAQAQLAAAEAAARSAKDTYDKQQRAFDIDPHAVSRDALDSARNAWQLADANRTTAQRQLELTRAGAWSYDVRNQAAQREALEKAYQASSALLAKYTLRAPADGTVLSIKAAAGAYITPQGVYDAYTQSTNNPVVVLGSPPGHLNVRCYVDEILIPRLPEPAQLKAQMFIRGTSTSVPLEFVRIEPYVSPKIALSDQRQERVDVRVLPVIFRFSNVAALKLYPGQLVDVYVGR
ncbi:MAG TPA: biotin/lipoyl-binding protein [Burkholderiaceae bacterium]|nr:biotin/lipoyl-binding protein [Burkholderiaceae bacterium]